MYATLFSSDPLHITLLSILGFMASIQLYYYLRYYRRSVFNNNVEKVKNSGTPPLSVIICARNEAFNLENFLPAILHQDYPSYEVIVVNDGSEDESDIILDRMKKEYPHLRVSTIQKDLHFSHCKKLPLLIGIKAAANDLLVFIDADCKPESDKWLSAVASGYNSGAEIVLGYGGYLPEKGLLNKYIRYETMFIAMQYMGMALAGRPYMGVGRNLAYRRSFFFEKGGFGPYNHIQSGDDDLFVNRTATSSNTYVMLEPGSLTLSVPSHSFEAWVRQKCRHYTTAKYYRFSDKFRLFMEPFSRVSYYGLMLFFLITLISWPVVAVIGLFRLITRVVIIKHATSIFKEPGIFFISLLFDTLHPLLSTILYITDKRKGRGEKSWK
jgi:poly-beta-1,6-N-acetyl-D-glucosamine synthase